MKKKVALFDFDGTLAHTVEEGVLVFNKLAKKYNFREITRENAQFLRDHGPGEARKLLQVSMLKVPVVLGGLRSGLREKIADLTMPSGVRQTLLDLKQKGYALGIVTSNSKENVMAFLKKNKIEVFEHIYAGSSLFGKAQSIKKALARHGAARGEAVFVGDEIRDIEAGRKNKIRTIAVTWGVNSRKGLEKARPDFVVDAPHELTHILD